MASQIQDVQVERPREYRISPQWKASVSESAVNRYRMKISPLAFSTDRASFSWRAPGTGTIMSPNVMLECQFYVIAPTQQDLRTMLSPTWQVVDTRDITTDGNEARLASYGSKICMGAGDAFGRAITNYQLTVNGASITQSRQNLWKQAIDRTWFGVSVFTRRFSSCGGRQDQYDSTAVGGVIVQGAAANSAIQGFTGDSGISTRIKSYLDCVTGVTGAAAEAGATLKVITVRWPVHGVGCFSPIGAQSSDVVGPSCPYKRSAYALAHFNVCSLNLLFKDLKECLFRNLSRGSLAAAANGNRDAGRLGGGVRVMLKPDSASLNIEYLRLSSFRGIPRNINLQVFRVAVHTPSKETHATSPAPSIPAAVTRSTVNRVLPNALICIGSDPSDPANSIIAGAQGAASFRAQDAQTMQVEWNSLVSAQCPQYLAFVLQKSSDVFILGNEGAATVAGIPAPDGAAANPALDDGQTKAVDSWSYTPGVPATTRTSQSGLDNYFLSRNSDANASIEQFELEIQSAVGSYVYADDTAPYLKTRKELFRDHLRYCVDDYLGGDFGKWSRHQCCLLLGADSFIRGLCTPGSSFPISVNAKVKFASRRQYVDGHAVSSEVNQIGVLRDVIQGTPVCLMMYTQGSLSLTASSAILSSQNLGHQQSMEIVSGRSRRQ